MKNRLYLAYLYFVMFYILFVPTINLLGTYTKYIIALVIFLIECIKRIRKYKLNFFNNLIGKYKNTYIFKYIFITFVAQLFFMIIVLLFNNNMFENFRILQYLFTILQFCNVLFVFEDLLDLGFNDLKIKKFIINLFIFQGLSCLLMLIISPMKELANFLYNCAGHDNIFVLSTRVFGITSDYTFGLPIIAALVGGTILFEKEFGKNRFIYSLIIVISTFLNNRTGILIYFIFIILYFINTKQTGLKKFGLKQVLSITVISCLILIFINIFSPNMFEFIKNGCIDIKNLFFGKYTGNFFVLKNMIFFPNNIINIVFGAGHRVFGNIGIQYGYQPSDIGFINDIFMGGIIYSVILIYSLYLLLKCRNRKHLMFALVASLLIINIKGELFRSTYILTSLFTLSMFFINNKPKEKKLNNEKISIICPMYNVEKYVGDCIDSIINNSYKNIELILVDDGSTDNTLKIAKEKSELDNRILVLEQKNMGAPTARNYGMSKSSGKYIMFFDSDDLMDRDCILKLYQSILGNDISFGNYIYIDSNNNKLNTRMVTEKFDPFNLNSLYFLAPFPNNKMFKASIIRKHNIEFDNVRIAQDLNFYLKYLKHVKKAGFTLDFVCLYRIHETGISRNYSLKILEIEKSISLSQEYTKIYTDEYKAVRLEHYYCQMAKVSNYNNEDKLKIKQYFKNLVISHKLYKNKYFLKTIKYILGMLYYYYK